MKTLKALWEFGQRPSLSLYHVELFSVAVTLVVYVCMLAIARGVVQRGTSFGVPLKNFLSGLILSALALAFTDSSAPRGPAYVQNTCGVIAQLLVCLTILTYSTDFNRDLRFTAAAGVLFSVLANMQDHALSVLTLWSSVHLTIIPAIDYINTRRSGVSQQPDPLTLTLMVSGALSLLGWGTFILMSGLPGLAIPNYLGAALAVVTLANMYSSKVKVA